MTTRDEALRLAGLGYAVFPVEDKRPLTTHGHLDATADLATVEEWWTQFPVANIGFPCGPRNGVIGVDIDAHKGGLASLKELVRENGRPPETPLQRTPRTGYHLLFENPSDVVISCSVERIGKGIDIRGEDKGYIVVAPSRGANGRRYEWIRRLGDTPLAAMPEWLIELAKADHPLSAVRVLANLHSKDPRPEFYVPLLTNSRVDSRGFALCPAPTHGDTHPTLKQYSDSWTCYACQLKGRHRQLAALALGIGTKQGWSLVLTTEEQQQADAHLRELGIVGVV